VAARKSIRDGNQTPNSTFMHHHTDMQVGEGGLKGDNLKGDYLMMSSTRSFPAVTCLPITPCT